MIYPFQNFDEEEYENKNYIERSAFLLKKLEVVEVEFDRLKQEVIVSSNKLAELNNQLNIQFEDSLRNRNLLKIEILLEIGCAVDAVRGSGLFRKDRRTALMRAVEYDDLELIKLLLNYDADPLAEDVDGVSPLNIAFRKNSKPITQLLVRRVLFNELNDLNVYFNDSTKCYESASPSSIFYEELLILTIQYGYPDLLKRLLSMGVISFNCDEYACYFSEDYSIDSDLNYFIEMSKISGNQETIELLTDLNNSLKPDEKIPFMDKYPWFPYFSPKATWNLYPLTPSEEDRKIKLQKNIKNPRTDPDEEIPF